MSNLQGVGFLSDVSNLPNSKTKVAKITILAGEDKGGKKRFMNGSFIITSKTKGIEAAIEKLNALKKEKKDAFVDVEVMDIYGEASMGNGNNPKLFVNYRGLLKNCSIRENNDS